MAGLDQARDVFAWIKNKTWMPGTRAGNTKERLAV
jgi:hypothetical protein